MEVGSAFDWKNEIAKVYYNPKEPGSFFGPEKIFKILKAKDAK